MKPLVFVISLCIVRFCKANGIGFVAYLFIYLSIYLSMYVSVAGPVFAHLRRFFAVESPKMKDQHRLVSSIQITHPVILCMLSARSAEAVDEFFCYNHTKKDLYNSMFISFFFIKRRIRLIT